MRHKVSGYHRTLSLTILFMHPNNRNNNNYYQEEEQKAIDQTANNTLLDRESRKDANRKNSQDPEGKLRIRGMAMVEDNDKQGKKAEDH